jgi:trehalose-phosphatase
MGHLPAPWREARERASFFADLSVHPSVLMLDYDGTLAPFHQDRLQAFPFPGVMERLPLLISTPGTRLVLVTGRPARELGDLVRLSVEVWGTHGRERLLPGGSYQLTALDPVQLQALDRVAGALRAEKPPDGLLLERKPASLAIHWRALTAEGQGRVRQQATSLFREHAMPAGLDLLPFDGGLEVRSAKVNKGSVVDHVLAESGDSPAAYLGDDLTDEDAFERLRGRGLTVLVRGENRPSAAEYWLRPPEELLEFLDQWIGAAAARRGP